MKDEEFAELVQSIEEMKAIRRGRLEPGRVTEVPDPDVAALRREMELTQDQFAALLGISARTVQDWEQGRRSPRGPARALLRVAEHSPRTVLEAMTGDRLKSARRSGRSMARRSRQRASDPTSRD